MSSELGSVLVVGGGASWVIISSLKYWITTTRSGYLTFVQLVAAVYLCLTMMETSRLPQPLVRSRESPKIKPQIIIHTVSPVVASGNTDLYYKVNV